MYAQIIVDIVHENVAKLFTYIIPPNLNIELGMRVDIPFGRRIINGLVIEVNNQISNEVCKDKLKEIISVKDEYPAILPNMIKLAKQMAEEAHCPIAETLRLMMPPAMRKGKIQIKYEIYASIDTVLNKEELDEAIAKQGRSLKRKLLLNILSDGKEHSIKDLSDVVSTPKQALKELQEQRYVKLEKREIFRLPYEEIKVTSSNKPTLMNQQQLALKTMIPSLKEGQGAFLIQGVTGSGKTEVYMRMIETVISIGKGAIVLVPEISLTPQMVNWFRNRFSNGAAVLHSGLTNGEKYDEWRRIRLGYAKVVIGARSAIFAPIKNLGLVVVDEEHETTYVSDRHPRYDARHIAKLRAENEHATLVLSSATPSILSFAMAMKGHYTMVEMSKRVMERPMPKVSIVDMRVELANGNRSIFSMELQEKMKKCIDQGQQMILFLNRRGYSTFVSCRSCGHVMKCDNCDVSLTYHKPQDSESENLHCHLCGAKVKVPHVCPQCGSSFIRYFGTGTQKVEDEIKKIFPNVKVIRMDNDTTQKRNSHVELLNAFRQGEAQILIGTQMITKGHDFPHVTLVGVIAADITLNLPDYRAPERTFQLLTQVAGRAGRADDPGEVVIQTYKPEHPCIQEAAMQDYRSFFVRELERRRKGLYPPYTQLTRMLIESKQQSVALNQANVFKNEINTFLKSNNLRKQVLMINTDEAPIKKIRNYYRFQILIKLFVHEESETIIEYLENLSRRENDNCNIYLEVNPINMM